MAGFLFRLELEGGTPADPPILDTAVPNWRAGDTTSLHTHCADVSARLNRWHVGAEFLPFLDSVRI